MTTYKTISSDYVLTSDNGDGLVTINGSLTVSGTATAGGNLSVIENTTVGGNLSVIENTTVSGNLSVVGTTNFNGNTTANIVTIAGGLILPIYTTAAADSLGEVPYGAFAMIIDGDSGNPCLSLYNGNIWARIPLGNAISST